MWIDLSAWHERCRVGRGSDIEDRDGRGASTSDRRADPDTRARTHLANERTFLAWLRTGLSLVALGLVTAEFLERALLPGVPVTTFFSLFLVASGMILTVLGGIHFFHARDEIDAGAFLPSTRATVVGMAVAIIAGVLALALVVLIHFDG